MAHSAQTHEHKKTYVSYIVYGSTAESSGTYMTCVGRYLDALWNDDGITLWC